AVRGLEEHDRLLADDVEADAVDVHLVHRPGPRPDLSPAPTGQNDPLHPGTAIDRVRRVLVWTTYASGSSSPRSSPPSTRCAPPGGSPTRPASTTAGTSTTSPRSERAAISATSSTDGPCSEQWPRRRAACGSAAWSPAIRIATPVYSPRWR